MKIPPKKPHFFQPILSGFENGLNIPIGFLMKYLKGQDHYEHAILRRAGKKWLVKMNGRRLEEGNWKEFIEEYDLQLGDLLIFKYEGDMEFEVSIFNLNLCVKEYTEYLSEDEDEGEEKPFGQSYVECIIRKYCLSRGFMFLPQQFAIANGLTNKKCVLTVRDERQKSWNLRLSSNGNRAYIGDGWRVFAAENILKEGDRIMFEIVTNGETPIWKFQVEKFQEYLHEDKDEDEDEPFGQSHFVCIIRQYCLSRGSIFLPQQFAIANGLTNKKCALIVRDERQRSWNLKLGSNNGRAHIGEGWRKFATENLLKEGDRIMFEIITNGETPIWKFRVEKFQEITKKPSLITSTYGDEGHPYFVSTIKPYCISKSVLYLPLDFAKSNGLVNRKCEMILKNEAQRCWSVWLGRASHHFGIINGWIKFRTENRLQVGDSYKFELYL